MEHAINFFKTHFGQASSTDSNPKAGKNQLEKATDASVISFPLERRRVVGGLVVLAAILIAANLAVLITDYLTGYDLKMVQRLVKVFSVDYELNAPAFFSTLILLFSSVLLAVITHFKREQRSPYVWYWTILSLGFLFMAFDEMASVHERLIEPMRTLLGGDNLGVLYFAWVVPAILLVLLLGVAFTRFWWNLPRQTRLYVAVAAALYLGGAIGIELLDGSYAEIHGKKNLTYTILSTVEETLEMAGIIVFIKALLDYIAENYRIITCHFAR